MISKKQYLIDLYWHGSDKRDPLNLPSWFSGLLEDKYVKILNEQNIVIITEKGLDYIDSLGIIDCHSDIPTWKVQGA